MDLAFQNVDLAGVEAAVPDYGLLVATLAAWQLASAAARAEAFAIGAGMPIPLVDLLLGAGGWREAAMAQGGSFNMRHARQASARKPK